MLFRSPFLQPFKLQDRKPNLLIQELNNSRSSLSDLELNAIREILSYTGGGALQQLLQQFDPHDFCKFLFAEIQILRVIYETNFANFSNSWWQSYLSSLAPSSGAVPCLPPLGVSFTERYGARRAPSCPFLPLLAPSCPFGARHRTTLREGTRRSKRQGEEQVSKIKVMQKLNIETQPNRYKTNFLVVSLQNRIFGNFQASRSFVSNICNIKIRKIFSRSKTSVQPSLILSHLNKKGDRSGLFPKSNSSFKKDLVGFSQSLKKKTNCKAKFCACTLLTLRGRTNRDSESGNFDSKKTKKIYTNVLQTFLSGIAPMFLTPKKSNIFFSKIGRAHV